MTTKFSFEVPVQNLDDFHEFQDYIFALSFLLRGPTEKTYFNYLDKCKREGKTIILDNSFNELDQPDDEWEMLRLYNWIKPDYLVAPDSNYWLSDTVFNNYFRMLRKGLGLIGKLILVIRSNYELNRARALGIRPLAVPFEYRPHFSPRTSLQKLHFLGFLNPLEITTRKPLTCDTTMPVKLALLGWSFEEWVLKGFPHLLSTRFPGLLTTKLTDFQMKLAIKNTLAIKETSRWSVRKS